MTIEVKTQFYAQVTRHFVVEFLHQLSKAAARVYFYLRSWLISAPGQASPWRELRVSKIADDLDWSARHVRRGLAELQRHKLIERREQHVALSDGTHPQVPNLWRILPEPGFPALEGEQPQQDDTDADTDHGAESDREDDQEPPPPPSSSPHETPPAVCTVLEPLLAEEGVEVVAATPRWLEDGIETLLCDIAAHQDDAAQVERALNLGTMQDADSAQALLQEYRSLTETARGKLEQLRGLRGTPADQLARHWFNLVASTIGQRVARRLREGGWRQRKIERVLTAEVLTGWLQRYLDGCSRADRLPAA